MSFSINVFLEIIAVITGIVYPYLAGKNKTICWLFAIISALVFVYINYSIQLYFFTGLQFLYVIIAIYGWLEWKKESKGHAFRFLQYKNIPIVLIGIGCSFALAYLAEKFSNQRMPYLDAVNFIFALIASYMITKKIMEAWLYLFVLNILSVYIYFQSKMYLTIVLYLFLTFLAMNAFKDWWKIYKANKEVSL